MSQEISLSLEETNKIRTQLGLKPIEEKPISHNNNNNNNVIELSLEETNKLRLSLGLKPIPIEQQPGAAKTIVSNPNKRANDELLSQRLSKAKLASEKRKLLATREGADDDDELDTDNWLSNVGKAQSAKKQKFEKVSSKKQQDAINAHIGHSEQELQNLRNNDILTLQDTDLLKDDVDDDGQDVLVNEELSANAKLQKDLNERREAEMIKFNGRHYKRNDDAEGEGELGEGTIQKKSVIIKNSSIKLNKPKTSPTEQSETVPHNTTKFSNFFDSLEELSSNNPTPKPQIKMKKIKKKKPLDSLKGPVSTRIKADDFDGKVPNIDESDYDNLQENYLSIAQKSKQKQKQAQPRMTPEEIALEIARNKKIAIERQLEQESMRRQFLVPSEPIENLEDLDTVGFLNKLDKNTLHGKGDDQGGLDGDIFDTSEKEVVENGHHQYINERQTGQDGVNGSLNTEEVVTETSTNDGEKENTPVLKETSDENHPRFNTGLADTLKFLKSRSNDNSLLQQHQNNSSNSSREELSKETGLLKLKVDIEERILREELAKNKNYMKLSKIDREKVFETELDKRLTEKSIFVNGNGNGNGNTRFNQSNGKKKKFVRHNAIPNDKTSTNEGMSNQTNNVEDKYASYNPKVELSYKDDEGKSLNTKQAYKHLSHKYHGMTTNQRLAKSRKKREKEKDKDKAAAAVDGSNELITKGEIID
ncbi:hypothetical protein CANMA_002686 [Candida margitis]|uniref:uncharacterized protein n=1 Tax=Candida margitis TaxID=1775924 RepID=UPI002227A796|nr:uncharacterized protein CANMA_002686 [Candida margitis]KAI5967918.1 hypothetical protein CANMA_002686 [Candida margitis]